MRFKTARDSKNDLVPLSHPVNNSYKQSGRLENNILEHIN